MKKAIRMLSGAPLSALLALAFVSSAPTIAFGASASGTQNQSPANYQAWLTNEVGHKLRYPPFFSIFDNLEYQVQGTTVVLKGQVFHAVLKDEAVAAVKKIEGVTAVQDQIQVLPLSRMDDRIRLAEFRSIYGFPSLNRYALGAFPTIHIIVDNGRVTLAGAVSTETDKNVAGIRANAVPGVFSVTNNLQVARG